MYNRADDLYANKNGFFIDIYHVPSGESVQFKAFITQFDDQYNAEFGSEDVFGRMDSIQVYKGTTRKIGLAWDVPSGSELEAVENINKCSKLMNMLYPVYTKVKGTGQQGKVLNAPPVFKIKFANLIRNSGGGSHGSGGTARDSGLFGTINGFAYAPDMQSGFLEIPISEEGKIGDPSRDDINLIPQTISLSCDFTVVHTHDLGFDDAAGTPKRVNSFYPFATGPGPSTTRQSGNTTGVDNKVNQSNESKVTDKLTGQ